MVLLRRIIGETLRSRRRAQRRTLRDVSASANVSLGYLSEIERGQKEASSELLSSICTALDVPLSDVLGEVTTEVAKEERQREAAAQLSPVSLLQSVSHFDDHRKSGQESRPVRKRAAAPVSPPVSLAAARARRVRGAGGRPTPKAGVAALRPPG
ncbi:transcriptional regulator with XRE-family HTH domain [Stackebrandtia albiflava]|uniref:Transcriptional regulator with XRE-family HTH domain n=1 Tax=Stackebrandtia albiflava TaxID=406432 RepID=A0A562VGW3_9ACTN|nr:helix-turn-helix domain-containing protein [Stackebrandtia albiflava]TWJ17143.1 transcriptional regulator with XRE-family HTH domain [Stackebrandtia albiflava]